MTICFVQTAACTEDFAEGHYSQAVRGASISRTVFYSGRKYKDRVYTNMRTNRFLYSRPEWSAGFNLVQDICYSSWCTPGYGMSKIRSGT